MKQKSLLLLLFVVSMQAQLIVNPNPFGINSGTITVTYGSTGDYSLFDPLSDPNLLLYTGLETDGVVATWDFHDNFTNIATMTPLTYNAGLGYYVATLDIGSRSYLQEPALNSTTIPNGVTVNNWYFLIRNIPGDRQSADLIGTNYGFQPSMLSVTENVFLQDEILISNHSIKTKLSGETRVEIFNLIGQKVLDIVLTENQTKEFHLNNSNAIFIAVVSNKNRKQSFKFSN